MDSLNLDEDPTSPDWILIETEANRVARKFLGSTSSNESLQISDQTINSILEETEAPDLVGLDSPATWHSRVKALDLDRDNSRFLPSPSSVRSIYNVMSSPAQAHVKEQPTVTRTMLKQTSTDSISSLPKPGAGSRTTRDPQPRKSLSRATPSQSTNSIGPVDRVEQKPTVPAGSKTFTRPSKPESKVPGRESLEVEQDTGKNDRKSQLPCPPASKIARKFSGIKPPINLKSSLPTLSNAFQRANKSVSSAIARPSQPDTVKPGLSKTITQPNLKRSIGGMIPAPAASKLSKLKPPAQQLRLPAQQIKKPVGPPQQKLPQEVTKTVTRTKTRPTENTGPMRATLPIAMTEATNLEEEVGRGRPTLGGGTVTRPSAPLAPPSPSILASAIPAETPIRRQDTVNPRRLSNVFFSPKRNSNMDSAPESKLPTPSTFKIPRHSQLSSSSSVGSSRSQNQNCSSDDFDAFKPRSRMVMNTPEVEPSKPPGRWSPALRRLSTVPDDERFFTCTKREPPVMALKNYKE